MEQRAESRLAMPRSKAVVPGAAPCGRCPQSKNRARTVTHRHQREPGSCAGTCAGLRRAFLPQRGALWRAGRFGVQGALVVRALWYAVATPSLAHAGTRDLAGPVETVAEHARVVRIS